MENLITLLVSSWDEYSNIILAQLNVEKKKIDIVGIDNDHAFADPICRHKCTVYPI